MVIGYGMHSAVAEQQAFENRSKPGRVPRIMRRARARGNDRGSHVAAPMEKVTARLAKLLDFYLALNDESDL